ncbi:hypothetical protein GOODEAATRI_005700, partial [Goodea atripinnis]
IWWSNDMELVFRRLEEGYELALKDYNKKQAFQWLSQLRHCWNEELQQCYVNICDAQFLYSYEYVGNTSRLVITPLTDRPCAMVVPDTELICEIMLVAEGFRGAKLLARKFTTLYNLCNELLSKQAVVVHTAETVRLSYFLNLLLERRQPVMLVGNAGVGKTALVRNKLDALSESYTISKVPFNYYTTSLMLQGEWVFDLAVAHQGILLAGPETVRESTDLVGLWLHESCRVYSDRLVDVKDLQVFQKIRTEIVVLCTSPVGSALRVRARQFPALINSTTIDWFHPWTTEALQSVSYRFILEIDGIEVSVALTDGLDPILMLTDDATVAAWHNQGLPSDRMSTENAAILTTSERWPLIFDPQQQAIKWIRNRLGPELRVVRLGQKG